MFDDFNEIVPCVPNYHMHLIQKRDSKECGAALLQTARKHMTLIKIIKPVGPESTNPVCEQRSKTHEANGRRASIFGVVLIPMFHWISI